MQVLKGFWTQMLCFLRLWKASDVNLWFYAGFRRFWKQNVIFAKVLKVFWWNNLVFQRFWKVRVSKRTSASKLFHFIIKSMPCEPFWSSGRPDALELPIHQFSLSNQCPGKHFRAQAPQSSWNITFHQQMDAISVRESWAWDVDWFGSLGRFEVELIEVRFVYQGIPTVSTER